MAATLEERPPPAPVVERGERGHHVRRRLVPYALSAPGSLWLVVLFLVPMVFMATTALSSGGLLSGGFSFSWAWDNFAAVPDNKTYFLRSVEYSALTTVAGLLLAYPLAYWIAFHGGRFKSTLLFLVLLPFFVSYVVRTVQWRFLLADHGILLSPLKSLGILSDSFHVLATPLAVVSGMTYNFLPFTMFPLYVALERIDPSLVEAAKDLYATRSQAFRKVVLPLSMPGVFAASLLTFVPSTGDYVEAEILGSPRTTMIGNIIQRSFLTELNYPRAAALSIVLMVGMVVLVSVYAKILGTEEVASAAGA